MGWRDIFRRRKIQIFRGPTYGDEALAALLEQVQRNQFRPLRTLMARGDPQRRDELANVVLDGITREPAWLGQWIAEKGEEPDALLLAGLADVVLAWHARGSGYADTVTEEGWSGFYAHLQRSQATLARAAEAAPQDPLPWAYLLIPARGLGAEHDECRALIQEVRRRDPHDFVGHQMMLNRVMRKWGGSHEMMWDFVRESTAQAPAGALVHGLVPLAHWEHWGDHVHLDKDDEADNYFRDPEVVRSLKEAYAQFSATAVDSVVRIKIENHFAFCCYWSGLYDEAEKALTYLDGRMSESPWFMSGDPETAYRDVLSALGFSAN